MSILSKDFLDPIKQALARVISSPTAPAPQKAAATAALTAYTQVANAAVAAAPGVVTAISTGQSPAAAASPVVGALETGLINVVGAFAGAAATAYVPVVGTELAPVASEAAEAGFQALLALGEQEAHNVLAGLFAAHAANGAAATAVAAPAPQLQGGGA